MWDYYVVGIATALGLFFLRETWKAYKRSMR